MRWPWQRRREGAEDRRARSAAVAAGRRLQEERARLDEAAELARRLARHRQGDQFAEAMRIALGGRP